MEFFDTPPVRYMGAKWQLSKWIIDQIPPHQTYVEPFCGSAAVFFRKHPSNFEIINDLSGEIINFFKVLREQPDELIRMIELTPFSLSEYRSAWELIEEPIERARRFYVRSLQSFNGDTSTQSGWRRYKPGKARGRSAVAEWCRLDGLRNAVERLKHAQIDNMPALECIKRYDAPDTFFYIDPPYVHSTRESLRHKYRHEMTNDDHKELAALLNNIKGMALVSGYASSLYDELYPGWSVTTKTNTTSGNGVSVEYLWHSPNAQKLSVLPLFSEVIKNERK